MLFLSTEISESSAREFAVGGVALFVRSRDFAGIPRNGDMDSFRLENLSVTSRSELFEGGALDLYDIEGRLLFRDFVAPVRGDRELRVRTAANALLGWPLISVEVGRPLPIAAWIAEAADFAQQNNLVPLEGPERLVCYSYPKFGLLCRMPPLGKKYVVDLADRSVIAVTDHSFGSAASDLLTTWSPFDRVERSSVPRIKERWAVEVDSLQAKLSFSDSLEGLIERAQALVTPVVIDNMRLHAQTTEANCSAATAWMILDYHHVSVPAGPNISEMVALSTLLKVGSLGATNNDQVGGYRAILQDGFDVLPDNDPEFGEAVVEINAARPRPLKCGIIGHARVVAGWSIEPDPAGTKRSLLIYDPYPTNYGSIKWEKWDSIEAANYIFVRPR
jgi:hypothetical protein